MSRLLAIGVVIWLLFLNGFSTLQGALNQPGVPQTIINGAARLSAGPLPTAAMAPVVPPAQTIAARAPVVQPLPIPTTIRIEPTPLPTVAPAIPLAAGEYVFIDRGQGAARRYCVQVPALQKQICDQDVSMTYPDTQMFLARSLKLGTLRGEPIE